MVARAGGGGEWDGCDGVMVVVGVHPHPLLVVMVAIAVMGVHPHPLLVVMVVRWWWW